jgi:Glycine rich protein
MYRARVFLIVLLGAGLWPAAAGAHLASFSYTGGEQAYTAPANRTQVLLVATGAAGGTSLAFPQFPGGRGATVSGVEDVTPGEVLYVEVGGVGGNPAGGFNGGGNGAVGAGVSWVGGGGASDVRTVSRIEAGTLDSRVIVAGGGGAAPNGGDAGQPGKFSAAGGGAGAQTFGGAGGCPVSGLGCGGDGTLGQGGDGGFSGTGADQRFGGGGGGGLYGGGGGGADLTDIGGGGGGSSLLPADGSQTLASLTTPASVMIAAPNSNKPLNPGCVGQQVTSFVQGFGSIAAAAHAFGITVQQGVNFIFAQCSR